MELKPKCGFLPSSRYIHPKHEVKLRIPRFQLHQHLKLAQVSFGQYSGTYKAAPYSHVLVRSATLQLVCSIQVDTRGCRGVVQGKVKVRSAYNPLDLFSGDGLRMQQALSDLIACPQNNFRLFVGARLRSILPCL